MVARGVLIGVVLWWAIASGFGRAQTPCSCGGKNCIVYTMNCQQCALSVCPGQTDSSQTSDPIDNCQTPTPLACALYKVNGSRVICGNEGKVTQCYERQISTSGVDCNTGVIYTVTYLHCCEG